MSRDIELVNDRASSIRLFNPDGFDPRKFLPEKWWKHADSVRYFVHTLHQQRFMYRRAPDDFVEVKAAYMLPFFTDKADYKPVVEALKDAGVLECDGHYIAGQKSLGYRLGQSWHGVAFRSVRVTNPALVRKVTTKRDEQRARITDEVHLYLRGWVERLDFDFPEAAESLDRNGTHDYMPMIEMLRDKDLYCSVCKYGRVHHNLSSLRSDLRRFVSYKGMRLINLDVANSQPLLFCVIVIINHLNGGDLSSLYSWAIGCSELYVDLPEYLFLHEDNIIPQPSSAHPLRLPELITGQKSASAWKDTTQRLKAKGLPNDALAYIELTQRGRLYEFLMERANVPMAERQVYKRSFFGNVFFCKNRPVTKQAALFQSHFPNVYKVILGLKERDHRRLAHVLQRTESSLIINRIARRCMVEHPNVCVVTIHDSVMTMPDGVEAVERIMKQEFRRVGLDPTIRHEDRIHVSK